MKIRLFVGFFLLVLLGELVVLAQETNEFWIADTKHLTRVPSDEPFSERYLRYTLDYADQNTFQEVVLKYYPDPFPFTGNQLNSVGEDVFKGSFKDAARHISKELPLYLYLEGKYQSAMTSLGSIFSSRFSRIGLIFIDNTIDGVAEESLDPTSLTYQPKERWLQKIREDGSMSYGLRSSSSPYLFFSTHVRKEGRELAFINFRCYYRDLQSFQTKFLVSIPLDKKWSMDTGFIYSTDTENRKLGTVSVGVLRLERRIGKLSFAFMGCEISETHRVITGLSFRY